MHNSCDKCEELAYRMVHVAHQCAILEACEDYCGAEYDDNQIQCKIWDDDKK